MVIRNSAKYLAVAILAAACTVQETLDTQAPKPSEPVASKVYEPGVVTVEFDDALLALVEGGDGVLTKSDALNRGFDLLGVEAMERVFPYAGPYEERTRREGMHRFYSVRFSEDTPLTKAGECLEDIPGVISVAPQRIVHKRAFNDPRFSSQWHYVNTSNPGADINVQGVWATYTKGSQNVIVCVVDEPVDPSHPDLVANLWNDGNGHTGYNFARNSYDLTIRPPKSYYDDGDVGHGTHVAGTVAAVNNNAVGLCGIAGGDAAAGIPGVRLQSCAIFSGDKFASDAATANALKWGADHGAVISQNSWGYYADTNNDGKVSSSELSEFRSTKIDAATKAAIDYFIKYAGCDNAGAQLPDSPMKGGLIFFAAGNENINYDPICAYEPVIAVGAFRETGAKASYSNYGTWVDVAAPGGEGTSSKNAIWSTLPTSIESSGYGGVDWAGTSMACPHASGVAALIVSYYGRQGFTNEDAKKILFDGLGDTIGGVSPIGKKLDALRSFELAGFVDSDPLSIGPASVEMHAHETREYNLQVRSDDPSATVECTPGSDALTYDAASRKITIIGRNAGAGSYKAVFVLKQSAGDYTLELPYTILPNHAPSVNLGSYKFADFTVNQAGVTVSKNIPSSLADLFQDADGEILHVSVSSSNVEVVTVQTVSGKINVTSVGHGLARISITATDGLGEQAEISFSVAVKEGDTVNKTEVFPEICSDVVNVWPSGDAVQKYSVSVFTGTGSTVMECSEYASIYSPVTIDITGLAPGVYHANVTPSSGVTQRVSFVKI